MKILHTADWHLGKRLGRFSRLEEQEQVLNEICDIADQEAVNVILLAGDCFDTLNPPIDATELFYRTLKRLSANGNRLVVAIAGNHDSPDRLEAPHPLAKECGILFSGYPLSKLPNISLDSGFQVSNSQEGYLEIISPDSDTPLRLIHTPYANQQRLHTTLQYNEEDDLRGSLTSHWEGLVKQYCQDHGITVLLTHLFFTNRGQIKYEELDDEKSILHVGGAQEMF